MKSKIVGIDLGTSTSEIAVFEDGKAIVIKNLSGDLITPSVVGISIANELVVGKEAKDQLIIRPESTVMEVKRLMGSGKAVEMNGKEYRPEEISSYILGYLKKCAENHLGEKVERAVITVPAYFTEKQRRATVEAGKLAGFKVERIINEPTAAALTYGIERLEKNEHLLVYDLGGGTLDVTLLEMFEGVLEVKASSGNNKLGGKDFDDKLINYLVNDFNEKYDIDLSKDIKAMVRLKEAAETCKVKLSSLKEYKIVLPFIAGKGNEPLAIESIITRDDFERMIEVFVESTKSQIDIVLKDSELKEDEIDTILLVGGSTRIPLVKKFLERVFNKQTSSVVDPDLAVVMGAAIQSAILSDELSAQTEILITDVCPYTLGVEILDDFNGMPIPDGYSILINRNTTIPVAKEHVYYTAEDGQTEVDIKIYQGDYKKASMNNFLGNFKLSDIPEARAGEERIKVRFSYDVNGILQVEAAVLSTGKNANITIETTGVEMDKEIDVDAWDEAQGSRKYRRLIKKVEKYMCNNEDKDSLEMDGLLRKLKRAIIQGDSELAAEIDEELTDWMYELEA
ncbi:Hsp70 family protein [Clostridium sp.]|uniref:Hsp70 family protein n=1 Tax=Clostridium sp. TaxID=1506 RepID=UPI00262A12C5|nr:Hsp70 family protein [uncultured Clostridium sp.]